MLLLEEIYLAGINRGRTGFVMNPMRRVLWKLCRPYFGRLLAELAGRESRDAEAYRSVTQVIGESQRTIDIQAQKQSEIDKSINELRRTLDAQAHRIKMLERIIEAMQLSSLDAK
jgi:hypothetical protein